MEIIVAIVYLYLIHTVLLLLLKYVFKSAMKLKKQKKMKHVFQKFELREDAKK